MTPIPSWRQRGSTSCSISRCAASSAAEARSPARGRRRTQLLDVVVRHADPADLPSCWRAASVDQPSSISAGSLPASGSGRGRSPRPAAAAGSPRTRGACGARAERPAKSSRSRPRHGALREDVQAAQTPSSARATTSSEWPSPYTPPCRSSSAALRARGESRRWRRRRLRPPGELPQPPPAAQLPKPRTVISRSELPRRRVFMRAPARKFRA